MRRRLRFALAVAVCSCSGPAEPQAPPQPAPLEPVAAADPPGGRGAACSPAAACSEGLICAPLPGGYCSSFCGLTGTPCDGSCVESARGGEVCLKTCAVDADCRKDEGYLCDPEWKSCVLPNLAAILPKACPKAPGPARDPAFGASERWSTAAAPGLYQFEPAAVVAEDGGVVAMYGTRNSGARTEGNVLGVSRVDGQGRVTIDRPFQSDRTTHFDPWLARDRKGTLFAVWLGYSGEGERQQIGLARSSDGGATWSPAAAAHDPLDCKEGDRDCLDKPMVAVGPDPVNKAVDLTYVLYSAGETGLRVRASRDGGATFGKTATALTGMYGNATVGSDGRLHVVTMNGSPKGAFGSKDHKVEYTRSVDGGASFAKPIVVSAAGETLPFFFSNPSIAVDDRRGFVYVAYARGGRDAKWDIVVAASKDGGKSWTRATIGDDCAIHMVPNLALDPITGTLHVAWYDSSGARGRFAHATCPKGAATCRHEGAINDVPFAALSTVRHGAKWVGEYESLLVDAKRRVLHAVWSQPVDESGKVVSRIFHAAAKLPKR